MGTQDGRLTVSQESGPLVSRGSKLDALRERRESGEQLTPRERSTLNLALSRMPLWEPGQSGNPQGRPKRITSALEKKLTRKRALKVADALIAQAEHGNVTAFESLANRVEGKIPQAITGEDGGAITVEIITHLIGSRNKDLSK